MEFRPCIDIHNGSVKQIVGGSLKDSHDEAFENFVAEKGADYYASLYKKHGLYGGHIILLNGKESPYYEATRQQALKALCAFPGGMQIGGGVNDENAASYIEAGASHVIVTSFIFKDGKINMDNLFKLVDIIGKEHIVIDLSARKYEDGYHVCTDRWQNKSESLVDINLMEKLSNYCDEFLIHAVDVEGKSQGIEQELVTMLGSFEGCPITYAGGVHSYEDLALLKKLGKDRIHITIGSALDLFGGGLKFEKVCEICRG